MAPPPVQIGGEAESQKQRTDELRRIDHALVIDRSAAVRCHKAAKILRRAGIENVHELGSMNRS